MIVSISTLSLFLLLGGGPAHGRSSPESPSSTVDSHDLAEPPTTEICVGEPAPNFAYQGYDGRWMHLHHLLDQGPVLLVIGANEAQLSQIEREREALLGLGVVPVAIVDRKPGAARRMVGKLGLKYSVLADGRQVIAAQFNTTHAGRMIPSWFVVDGHGKVRGLLRGGLPSQDYPRLCARALAMPLPGSPLPASR